MPRSCRKWIPKAQWWPQRFAEKQKAVEAGGSSIVFLGDSITHYWDVGEGPDTSTEIVELRKKFSILNCGYGGDQTQHLLWRAKYGELDGYEANLVMSSAAPKRCAKIRFRSFCALFR
ncbi:MAG: hypothetical protein IJK04_03100 [Kiritimatiellae bacterium]|nr:hypothetical protein [Kiritimatiellia bacterium]